MNEQDNPDLVAKARAEIGTDLPDLPPVEDAPVVVATGLRGTLGRLRSWQRDPQTTAEQLVRLTIADIEAAMKDASAVAAVRGAEVEVGTLAVGRMFQWGAASGLFMVVEHTRLHSTRVAGPLGLELFTTNVKVRPLRLAVTDAPEGSGAVQEESGFEPGSVEEALGDDNIRLKREVAGLRDTLGRVERLTADALRADLKMLRGVGGDNG